MANTADLYDAERIDVPEDLVNKFWKSDSPDGLEKIDDGLKGGTDHSKLMLLLQNYIYDDGLNISGIERRHHDLVDVENKIMAEVGTNGLASNDLRDFLVRVFRLHYNRKEKSGISEWIRYYLNYDLDLYKVRVTDEGCRILRQEIEELEKGIREVVDDFSFQ